MVNPTEASMTNKMRSSSPSGKTSTVTTNLEPELYRLFTDHAEAEGYSFSRYVRKLILEDLVKRGKLAVDELLRLSNA